jgi:hypothetical protein
VVDEHRFALKWRQLELLIGQALDSERAQIGSEEARIIDDFIDHNEFGLAYDTLVDALAELNLTPSSRTNELLAIAAALMRAPSD